MNEKCSILINSCDKYRSAWDPFFILFYKYFKDCPYKVYLNTESLKYNDSKIVTLNSDSKSWSTRLIDSLEKINSKYVIMLLEDFFLQDYVDKKKIEEAIDILDDSVQINVIYFKKITGNIIGNYNDDYCYLDRNQKYLINFQAAIWRRDSLLKLLQRNKTPWQLEEMVIGPSNGDFLCMSKGSHTNIKHDVFPYLWSIKSGMGICKSKWLWNNKPFFKKEKIIVDFDELGIISKSKFYFIKFMSRWLKK